VHDLTPIHALGGAEAFVFVQDGTELRENSGLALASVHARIGHETACHRHVADLLGRVPGPGEAVLRDPEAGFWTGPDQWMIGAPYGTHEDLADQLKSRFGESASITEQSDAWCVFDLRGDIEPVMELLCAVDVRNMAIGAAQRTSIHHLGCFVLRRDPASHMRILGPRASAGSLCHAIVTAMKSAL